MRGVSQWWPRSLLWRTFLLVAALMLLSVAAWFLMFKSYEREPRARQMAQTLASVANLTRVSLLSARHDARLALLRELSDREGIHIYPSLPGETVDALPANPFLQRVHELVREKLGPETRMSLRRNDEDALFVSFRIDDEDDADFWLAMPRERIERVFPASLLGWGMAVVVLSLLGAWLIVFRITRPLKALRQAAQKVGAGEAAPPLAEEGPEELAAVARAFNHMGNDLARLDQDRALILAGISHDLRTPLTRLRMGIEMTSDPDMRDGMAADVEEMDKTISQFLDFARGSAVEGGAQESLVSLDPCVLVGELAEQYRRRDLAIVLAPGMHAASVGLVRARPQALRRALSNLIDNALRYAPGHPPELACRSDAHGVAIIVRDHGPGVPEHEFERLKRPFTRLDTARSNVVGAGLGLAIVERIALAHGGRLILQNAPDGGLVAVLWLPLA